MCFNLDWFRLIPSDSTYLGLIVCYSSVFSSFWYDVCWFDMLWANLSSLFLCDSMGIDSIWWGVVWFYSIWFDVISCDSVWFVLLWLNVIQCWSNSLYLVSSGVTRFNSMLLFDSIYLCCSVSMRFDVIHVYLYVFGSIRFGLIRCHPVQVWCGSRWLDFTRLGLTRFHSVWSKCLWCLSMWFDSSVGGSILFNLLWFGSIWSGWLSVNTYTFLQCVFIFADFTVFLIC